MNFRLHFLVFFYPLIFQLAHAQSFDELKVSYEVKMLEVQKKYSTAKERLVTGYLGALDQTKISLQKAGRLDDVLLVVEEIKGVKTKSWPLPRLAENAPADLKRIRKIYEKARIQAERANAKAVVDVAGKMNDLLSKMVVSLTKAGDLADAKRVRKLLLNLEKDPSINEASRFMERVRLDQKAPPAMQIRRSGDDLEVLVRYDRGGKISMDSPVENVVEITGGKGEKGKTKAEFLGEFVGAKGYTVDPYVSYQSKMDELEKPISGPNLLLKAGAEINDRKALQITMAPKAPNPRVEWSGVFAPISSRSGMLVDFHYLIPAKNKKLTAFTFHHNLSAPLDGEVMKKKGEWTKHTIGFESIDDTDMMRLFIEGLSGSNKIFDGGNESIYLDDLRVTHVSFTAYLVADFKEGRMTDIQSGESTQKPIILAGKLLPAIANQ